MEGALRELCADASIQVVRITAGLSPPAQSGSARERLLLFFLGSLSAFVISIVILISAPAASPVKMAYFLSPLPVFQLALSVHLVIWGTGFVCHVCDAKAIDHMFLLDVDPRFRLDSSWCFARAAGLSTCWVLLIIMYIVDYKWRLFTPSGGEGGSRESWHYVVYPYLALAVTLAVFAWPSRTCRFAYRLQLLRSIRRTALAPLYPVSFADNILGDVLTSLVKPLNEVSPAVCFIFSEHPQTLSQVATFEMNANLCPWWEHVFVKPCISALPQFFRAMQCVRRFRDTHDQKHLANFGKYCTSLLVVILSSSGATPWLVVLTSFCATMYTFAWDVTMDWGLSLRDFEYILGRVRNGPRDRGQELPSVADRCFTPSEFLAMVVLDLLFRCTWVITLMPVRILTRALKQEKDMEICVQLGLASLVGALEIARRSMWTVARMEYEQVSNAAGYGSLMWAPAKLNRASGRRALDVRSVRMTRMPPLEMRVLS